MVAVAKLTKEYHYKSELLRKGQVHVKFPHIIYRRKSFDNPFELFVYYFRLKGEHEYKVNVMRALVKFMDGLQNGKVDYDSPVTYFPLYVLESRWLLKYEKQKLVLNKKGRLWLEAMKETIELYGDLNEPTKPD